MRISGILLCALQFARTQENVMSFGIYSIGFLILIAGVAYLAHLMHIPQTYIIATVVILLGIGILTGVKSTRGKDPN
jgi:energy-converting hydrogenase Eha subunit C